MLKAWYFAIAAAVCVLTLLEANFQKNIIFIPSQLTLGHGLDVCNLGQGILPSNNSLDSGENE